jgi:GT2 family glycosyltransferase
MFINKKIFNKIGKFDKNFFLYFEETEYCKRASKIDLNCYQLNKIKVRTNGRTVAMGNKKEQDKLSNILIWHFIWSKYYYSKKNYGSLISVVIFIPILLRIIIKILFYKVFNNKIKIVKYKSRLNGLLSSMVGKRSSLRP